MGHRKLGGYIKCWGNNKDGLVSIPNWDGGNNQLLVNTTDNNVVNSIVSQSRTRRITHLSMTNRHACLINDRKMLYCWGWNK
mmetsp:Transcript_9701/g.8525  ORF Transcript_9701/g.8525 Transcript_9701/m.8525 type:complete len:82 (+) Transcript_9701:492-737(+)